MSFLLWIHFQWNGKNKVLDEMRRGKEIEKSKSGSKKKWEKLPRRRIRREGERQSEWQVTLWYFGTKSSKNNQSASLTSRLMADLSRAKWRRAHLESRVKEKRKREKREGTKKRERNAGWMSETIEWKVPWLFEAGEREEGSWKNYHREGVRKRRKKSWQ